MTTKQWLSFADGVYQFRDREKRIARQRAVREAIDSTEKRVLWNTRICDALDVAVSSVAQQLR